MAMPIEIQDFLSAVARSPDLWRSVDVRILAVRLTDGWHNLLTRCYLDSRAPDEVVRLPDLPVTRLVGCWQQVFAVADLEQLFVNVAQGALQVSSETVRYLATMAPPSAQQYSFSRYAFHNLAGRFGVPYRYWNSHSISASGNSSWDITSKVEGGRFALDNELRAHEAPFDGLDGVARFAIGSPDPLNDQRLCLFEAFAPLEALLLAERCHFVGGEAQFAIRAGSEAVRRRVQLGVFAVGDGPLPHRASEDLSGLEWQQEGPYWTAAGSFRLERAQLVTLILRLDGYAVHQLTLIDPSPAAGTAQMAVYRVFDPEMAVLTSSLAEEGSTGAKQFERAVARLFTLAGFQVDLLSGDKRLDEAVDLVAYAASLNACLAVECTTASIGSQGKPGRLVARLRAISSAVPTMEVWGVLATPLERARLATADLDSAATDGLVVLAREDLAQLLLFASNAAPVSDVLAYLRSRIPPTSRAPGIPAGRVRL